MNIQEEKLHIYSMMRDITAERRQLTDIYYGLKKQLDYLNNLEQRGLEDLSIKGYVDLYNETMKQTAITNLQRETKHQIEKIENENHHIIEEKEKTVVPQEVVEEAVYKEKRKRRKNISREKIESAIITVLKEAGMPIKFAELHEKINVMLDSGLNKDYMRNQLLPTIMERNPKIERPMRGYYQYRG